MIFWASASPTRIAPIGTTSACTGPPAVLTVTLVALGLGRIHRSRATLYDRIVCDAPVSTTSRLPRLPFSFTPTTSNSPTRWIGTVIVTGDSVRGEAWPSPSNPAARDSAGIDGGPAGPESRAGRARSARPRDTPA